MIRHVTTIALGFSLLSALACSSSNNNSGKGNIGAKCTTNANCASNSCVSGLCVAAGTGGNPFGSGGFPATGGDTSVASGGFPIGTGGGIVISSGGLVAANGGDAGVTPSSGGSANPDAGSGGSSGDSGTPSGDAGRPPKPGTGDILCNTGVDCSNRDTCCGTTNGTSTTYACSHDACNTGETTINCDGYEDCGSGKCCVTGGFTGTPVTYACAAQCTGAELQCSSSKNCNANQVCCETVGMFGVTKTACEDGTACAAMEFQLCSVNTDCAAPATCADSTNLPGFRRCK
jgi:hypothetical protein